MRLAGADIRATALTTWFPMTPGIIRLESCDAATIARSGPITFGAIGDGTHTTGVQRFVRQLIASSLP